MSWIFINKCCRLESFQFSVSADLSEEWNIADIWWRKVLNQSNSTFSALSHQERKRTIFSLRSSACEYYPQYTITMDSSAARIHRLILISPASSCLPCTRVLCIDCGTYCNHGTKGLDKWIFHCLLIHCSECIFCCSRLFWSEDLFAQKFAEHTESKKSHAFQVLSIIVIKIQ